MSTPTVKAPYIAPCTKNIRIKFQADHLPRLELFRAQDDIRYYLNGIRIERAEIGGLYLVATDGHTLMVIHDKKGTIEGTDGMILRTSPGLVAAARKKIIYWSDARIVIVGDRVSVALDFDQEHSNTETYVQAGNPWIEGNFPDWRRVLPDFANLKPGFNAAINGNFVARYAKLRSTRGFGHQNFSELNFWQERPSGPVIVQHNGIPEAVSIIMPMKSSAPQDMDGTALEKYFKCFPNKATAAAAEAEKAEATTTTPEPETAP